MILNYIVSFPDLAQTSRGAPKVTNGRPQGPQGSHRGTKEDQWEHHAVPRTSQLICYCKNEGFWSILVKYSNFTTRF